MVDLIVPAGQALLIDQAFAVAPKYDLFRMEANSTLRVTVDLALTASRAEFAQNCLIDASGVPGTHGRNAPANGSRGQSGSAGGKGRNVTISAALGKPGALIVTTDGGAGGGGGAGGDGVRGTMPFRSGAGSAGKGGDGGHGGAGGDAGQITLNWTLATPAPPMTPNGLPVAHQYRSNGGAGGLGGRGGAGASSLFRTATAPQGATGSAGRKGVSLTPRVTCLAEGMDLSLEVEDLEHWSNHRESLQRQIELMRTGRMKTLAGPSLENDTTAESLHLAEESLAAVEHLLARLGGT